MSVPIPDTGISVGASLAITQKYCLKIIPRMKLTEQSGKLKLLFNLDISSCSLQVHAQGGNCSEAQHSSAPTLHPGPQREDLPVLGDERRLPHGVAARGEGPAAPASPQPLSGEEEGDHQETPLLHRCDYECTAALRGRKSKQEIVASHQFSTRSVLSLLLTGSCR